MAPREELVASAVQFLQDPSVASAPLEKKIAFMQSKNLTQEEIDISLARAAGASTAMVQAPQMNQTQAGAGYRPPLPAGAPGYGGPWAQQQLPPPELPRRDWRDWFIAATVIGGAGYGLYNLTKRYITPLIAPPTPPQLQQDKEDIDEQFNKAFALIDQLTADTASLKEAEETRSEKLDSALREVESVTSDLRSSSRRRDDDLRRISEEIRNLKDAIPKAIEGERKGHERRLTELGTELKSLKVLLSNRLSSAAAAAPASPAAQPTPSASASASPAPSNGIGSGPAARAQAFSGAGSPAPDSAAGTPRSGTPFGGKSASIPAWQMAAANKGKNASVSDENQNSS